MEIITNSPSYYGWASAYPPGTGRSVALLKVKTIAGAAIVAALVVGPELPSRQLLSSTTYQDTGRIVPMRVARTSRENLARIREVFSPSISALAKSLDVTRQTIYNWQKGEPTSDLHAAKLDDLAKAADLLAAESVDPHQTVLEREFAGGKNLLQLVQDGGSAQEAIRLLIPVLQQEQRQRKELDILFANRKPSAPSADFDLIAPNDLK